MTYREFFKDKQKPFNIFLQEYREDFIKIFEHERADVLDNYATFKYGDKEILKSLTDVDYIDNIKAILSVYVGDWVRGADAMHERYTLAELTNKIDRKDDHTNVDTSTHSTEESDKVFNDTEFVSTEKNISTDERNGKHSSNSNVVEVRGVQDKSAAVEKEFKMRLQSFKENIIFAFITQLTKNIY